MTRHEVTLHAWLGGFVWQDTSLVFAAECQGTGYVWTKMIQSHYSCFRNRGNGY